MQDLLTALAYGVRVDLITLCLLFMVPGLILINAVRWNLFTRYVNRLARGVLLLSSLTLVFVELATPAFIDQFGTRPNRLLFEYLDTPGIAIATAVREYPLNTIAIVMLVGLAYVYLRDINLRNLIKVEPFSVPYRLALTPVFIVLLILGVRSSFDHHPANPGATAFSNDQLVNEIALNSLYTLLYEVYSLRQEADQPELYGKTKDEPTLRRVHDEGEQDTNPPSLLFNRESNLQSSSPDKITSLSGRSLSASSVGRLGGIGVTPGLDRSPQQKGDGSDLTYRGETRFDHMAGLFPGNGFGLADHLATRSGLSFGEQHDHLAATVSRMPS